MCRVSLIDCLNYILWIFRNAQILPAFQTMPTSCGFGVVQLRHLRHRLLLHEFLTCSFLMYTTVGASSLIGVNLGYSGHDQTVPIFVSQACPSPFSRSTRALLLT